ncbi:hypothetical protein ZWY2020_026449 [Hordeum vulgare]|nr:hypothetical protein ZWY2020_026449 [Hordeum vulgare]
MPTTAEALRRWRSSTARRERGSPTLDLERGARWGSVFTETRRRRGAGIRSRYPHLFSLQLGALCCSSAWLKWSKAVARLAAGACQRGPLRRAPRRPAGDEERSSRNRELADLADDVSFAAGLRRGEEGKEVRIQMAARVGDAAALRRALDEAALVVAAGKVGEGLEAVRCAVAAEANEAGETPLLAAVEKGRLEVVVELLWHLDT